VPDAAAAFAAQDAAERVKAMQVTTALQPKLAPREKITKAEASTAMPLPSQGSDDATATLDKGKGG